MCGIFGSPSSHMFTVLYECNIKRGAFSFGSLLINKNNDIDVHKVNGIAKIKNLIKSPQNYKFFLGHTQAPTSSVREYNEVTSHPFRYENWIVAHNGVLTNNVELNIDFTPWNDNPVDSALIPCMLHEFCYRHPDASETDTINEVLSMLDGTFGLWIYNAKSNNIYLARQGSTVYADIYNNLFSSVEAMNLKILEEGIIYQITSEGITQVGYFDNNSPFLVI